jgi:hypothetical protein
VAWAEVGAWLALRQHPVAPRRELRAQDELALETARLETAVCLGDLIEGDPLGDTRPNVGKSKRKKWRHPVADYSNRTFTVVQLATL